MSGNRVFFDSNIIVYLYTETELAKKRQALQEFISNDRYISTQVLNELSNVGFKKLRTFGVYRPQPIGGQKAWTNQAAQNCLVLKIRVNGQRRG